MIPFHRKRNQGFMMKLTTAEQSWVRTPHVWLWRGPHICRLPWLGGATCAISASNSQLRHILAARALSPECTAIHKVMEAWKLLFHQSLPDAMLSPRVDARSGFSNYRR